MHGSQNRNLEAGTDAEREFILHYSLVPYGLFSLVSFRTQGHQLRHAGVPDPPPTHTHNQSVTKENQNQQKQNLTAAVLNMRVTTPTRITHHITTVAKLVIK